MANPQTDGITLKHTNKVVNQFEMFGASYTTDVPILVEYKPLNIATNIQWILTCSMQWILSWNYSCLNMPIQGCDLWYESKTARLMDKSATSHLVDMGKGCHEAFSLASSLCHIHLMGYCIFIHQP